MPDFDLDRLNSAFDDFRSHAPRVRPLGFDAVRSTVTRRRRVRAAVLAAAAVLAVIIPVSVFAAPSQRGDVQPAQTTSATTKPHTSTPPPTTPPPDTAQPSVRTPNCDQPGAVSVPAGGIALADLCDSVIDIPKWTQNAECADGPIQFTNGNYYIAGSFFLNIGSANLISDYSLTYVDVNGDGKVETILLLSCGGEGWTSQVIALDLGTDGSIHTIARVLSASATLPRLISVAPAANGQIDIEVADFNGGLGDDGSTAQRQTRTYRYTGSAFIQSGGPTKFPPNPKVVDLSVTTTKLAFGAPSGGRRTGTLTATVHNGGTGTAPLSVILQLPKFVEFVPHAGCTATPDNYHLNVACTLAPIVGGAARGLTLTFTTTADAGTPMDLVPAVEVETPAGMSDPVFVNNQADIVITFA
jgi:hypothetical protein